MSIRMGLQSIIGVSYFMHSESLTLSYNSAAFRYGEYLGFLTTINVSEFTDMTPSLKISMSAILPYQVTIS
jgi:hypothetical protein